MTVGFPLHAAETPAHIAQETTKVTQCMNRNCIPGSPRLASNECLTVVEVGPLSDQQSGLNPSMHETSKLYVPVNYGNLRSFPAVPAGEKGCRCLDWLRPVGLGPRQSFIGGITGTGGVRVSGVRVIRARALFQMGQQPRRQRSRLPV